MMMALCIIRRTQRYKSSLEVAPLYTLLFIYSSLQSFALGSRMLLHFGFVPCAHAIHIVPAFAQPFNYIMMMHFAICIKLYKQHWVLIHWNAYLSQIEQAISFLVWNPSLSEGSMLFSMS